MTKLGTRKRRRRARDLQATQVGLATWQVTGGKQDHQVIFFVGIPNCDCEKWQGARNNACSHILAVMMAKGLLK